MLYAASPLPLFSVPSFFREEFPPRFSLADWFLGIRILAPWLFAGRRLCRFRLGPFHRCRHRVRTHQNVNNLFSLFLFPSPIHLCFRSSSSIYSVNSIFTLAPSATPLYVQIRPTTNDVRGSFYMFSRRPATELLNHPSRKPFELMAVVCLISPRMEETVELYPFVLRRWYVVERMNSLLSPSLSLAD